MRSLFFFTVPHPLPKTKNIRKEGLNLTGNEIVFVSERMFAVSGSGCFEDFLRSFLGVLDVRNRPISSQNPAFALRKSYEIVTNVAR